LQEECSSIHECLEFFKMACLLVFYSPWNQINVGIVVSHVLSAVVGSNKTHRIM